MRLRSHGFREVELEVLHAWRDNAEALATGAIDAVSTSLFGGVVGESQDSPAIGR
jgi:hypothetical protein